MAGRRKKEDRTHRANEPTGGPGRGSKPLPASTGGGRSVGRGELVAILDGIGDLVSVIDPKTHELLYINAALRAVVDPVCAGTATPMMRVEEAGRAGTDGGDGGASPAAFAAPTSVVGVEPDGVRYLTVIY